MAEDLSQERAKNYELQMMLKNKGPQLSYVSNKREMNISLLHFVSLWVIALGEIPVIIYHGKLY